MGRLQVDQAAEDEVEVANLNELLAGPGTPSGEAQTADGSPAQQAEGPQTSAWGTRPSPGSSPSDEATGAFDNLVESWLVRTLLLHRFLCCTSCLFTCFGYMPDLSQIRVCPVTWLWLLSLFIV